MQRLLYVSALGQGLPRSGRIMRSELILNALRGLYQVSLATPELGPPPDSAFDVIHVFRLAALPLAKPYLSAAGRRHLDLDDIESRTHRRIETIARANGHAVMAAWAQAECRRFELLEIAAFRKFDRVYVCSEADRTSLAARCPVELQVLPNVVRLQEPPPGPPPRSPDEPFRFLFIGTMDYYPNFDAYHWFCNEVLPILRRMARANFIVEVAGFESAGRLEPHESVCLAGEVPDVRPLYERAHAVIVPLRAGGGTRIKILEAFAFGRPVISTTIGAEGIEATPDRDILLADSPEAFAAACAELISNPDLGRHLAWNALRLVQESYSESALRRIVQSLPEAHECA
jgi:glycosyltransferase involved in cell wall biosynthesis